MMGLGEHIHGLEFIGATHLLQRGKVIQENRHPHIPCSKVCIHPTGLNGERDFSRCFYIAQKVLKPCLDYG
jgi:hypothetical protein